VPSAKTVRAVDSFACTVDGEEYLRCSRHHPAVEARGELFVEVPATARKK
jgi:hypothetical protein